MLKKINRVLRLLGLNLVRAKRRKGQRIKEEIAGVRPPYTVEELMNAPLKCAVNPPGAADYIGDAEWHDTGKTHYVGDSCPGGHQNICIGPKAKVQVVDLDAAFVPVDTDERPRVEQPNSKNDINSPTS